MIAQVSALSTVENKRKTKLGGGGVLRETLTMCCVSYSQRDMINIMGTVVKFAYVKWIMSTMGVNDEYPEQNKIVHYMTFAY